jgi:hypothetical protein
VFAALRHLYITHADIERTAHFLSLRPCS